MCVLERQRVVRTNQFVARTFCERCSVSVTTCSRSEKHDRGEMAGTRNMCALFELPIPNSEETQLKLRCVFTGRDIAHNLNFGGLLHTRMIIYHNSLWAIAEDRKKVLVFDVTTGGKQHEMLLPFGGGVGCTIFRDRVFVFTDHEIFEVLDGDTNTKTLKRVALCPHEIFALEIQRKDDEEIAFVVESTNGLILSAVSRDDLARCTVLKGTGHFLSGAYGNHIYIYCLESNEIVDTRNRYIERIFPPLDHELYGRFRMAQDGTLYYCSWNELVGPWSIESINTVTGNRTCFETDSQQIYLIPCAFFVPFYEPRHRNRGSD
ncbi:uncharacterized protein LOC100909111 isoform X2 [Galendromus occidentalis]|uniref:Uncharacterized protein LOC100909111 isoform X2 n=1 Tax=Galendromus occidentalis TaxID=34638 RepID=A0AAJ6VWD5_9ACAR|nr:uncharacterized protein LOC100909111 isoform X2 [Galendromus occidentalis]